MIKSKLLKAVALGLCMSVLVTGTAFAQVGGGSSPSFGGAESEETDILFEKQAEIDQYVFADHVEDIKKQGFQVNYTGVADTFVEIGISPYSETSADYLYEVFGKDIVKVVESEESALHTTAKEDNVSGSDAADTEVVDADLVMDIGLDTPVSNTEEIDRNDSDSIADEEQKMEIQIESLPSDVVEGEAPDAVPDIATEEATELARQSGLVETGQEVQIVSAQDDAADLATVTSVDEKSEGLSAPIIILIIAGGVVVLGGAVLAAKKKHDN